MISKPKELKRLCDVTTAGTIKELNFVCGPLYNVRLTLRQIHSMVSRGITVYEVNPNNKNEKTLLTLTNFNEPQYSSKKTEVTPAEEKPVVPSPVQEQVVLVNQEERKPKFTSVTLSSPNQHKNGKHDKHHDNKKQDTVNQNDQQVSEEVTPPTEEPITEVDG